MATSSNSAAASLSSASNTQQQAGAAQPAIHPHKELLSGKAIEELFVVLVVMAVVGIVATMVGRMCGGRHLGGDSSVDFEGWVEKRCAVCIDGEVGDAPPEGEPAGAAPLESIVEPPELAPPPPQPPEAAPPPEGGAASGLSLMQAPVVAQPYRHYYHHHPVPIYGCQSCYKEGLYHPSY